MSHVHNGLTKRVHGKMDSDGVLTKKLHHLKNIRANTGADLLWFRNSLNQIMLKHSGKWYTMDELARLLPNIGLGDWQKDTRKESVLKTETYKDEKGIERLYHYWVYEN